MSDKKEKPRLSVFRSLAKAHLANSTKDRASSPELSPAMPELGTAPCPVCGQRVAVFVTRTKRPFINCGFCSARIFYNGSRSMELLREQIESDKKVSAKFMSGLKKLAGGRR
jgi:DNA-directed RNA polymerase subunit RPC12/RpoP